LTSDLELCTDPRRVKVVVLDLLFHAIANSRRKGVVIVSQIRDEDVRVSMSEKGLGPGPSPLLLEQLFTPVTQRDLAQSTSHAVGLELTRSRSLMEGVGRAVGVDTTNGDGLTFWLDLPLTSSHVA
jgi:light-regulated signal transduction histidine kinase (bacteriophytochrome)